MKTAFKEWAVIVDALGRGDQIVILRKGGIAEARDSFQPEHGEFLLFPTAFHQQRESVLPAAQVRFDLVAHEWMQEERIRLVYWAKIIEARRLDTLSQVSALRGQHVWRDDVIAQRFEWGPETNIYALAVRVSRLANPVELPLLSSYAGCKSWIELGQDVDVTGSTPALSDPQFAEQLNRFRTALAAGSVG